MLMSKLPPISATIITLNEEINIVACIRSLRGLCQEVIVLDSNSTDATRELAQQEGAIVHIQKYLGDGHQKSKAAELASHDWILSIDADERPDDDLGAFISGLTLKDADTAYAFKRKNFLGTRHILAGGFYPDYVTRLYNKTTSGYKLTRKHSSVDAPQLVKANAHILHYTYADLHEWVTRLNWLSSRDAQAMYQSGKKPASAGGHATAAFIRKYFLKRGFLQGQDGLTVAMTTAFACYMKYIKLQEIYDLSSRPNNDNNQEEKRREKRLVKNSC